MRAALRQASLTLAQAPNPPTDWELILMSLGLLPVAHNRDGKPYTQLSIEQRLECQARLINIS